MSYVVLNISLLRGKHIVLRGGLLFLCALLWCPSANAELIFNPSVIEFGNISFSDKDQISTCVTIENNADKPTTLTVLYSSCSCTTSTDFPTFLQAKEKTSFSISIKKGPPRSLNSLFYISEYGNPNTYTLYVLGEIIPLGHIDIVPEALEISTTTTVGSKIGIAHIQLSDSVLSKSIELVSSTESLSFAHGAFTTPQTYNVDIILNKTLPLGLTYDTISVLKERSPIICKNLVISMISCFA